MKKGGVRFFIEVLILVLSSLWLVPSSHAQLSNGDILVIDPSAGTGDLGALFRVDPTTGNRTLLSDFGNAGQGATGVDPYDVAIESTGQILVIDYSAGAGSLGALFRVDPTTGNRTVLSNFGNAGQGTTGGLPAGIAIESTGQILVIGYVNGALFRIDPTTGNRTLLSDFGNAGQGATGVNPIDIAIESTGQILVIDPTAGTGGIGALFRVDPTTGNRTLPSDFGNAGQGTTGDEPLGVAVFQLQQQATSVPTMNEWGMIIFMILAGVGALYYLRRQRI
jgi:glucose/arabinose dehydrogenase